MFITKITIPNSLVVVLRLLLQNNSPECENISKSETELFNILSISSCFSFIFIISISSSVLLKYGDSTQIKISVCFTNDPFDRIDDNNLISKSYLDPLYQYYLQSPHSKLSNWSSQSHHYWQYLQMKGRYLP